MWSRHRAETLSNVSVPTTSLNALPLVSLKPELDTAAICREVNPSLARFPQTACCLLWRLTCKVNCGVLSAIRQQNKRRTLPPTSQRSNQCRRGSSYSSLFKGGLSPKWRVTAYQRSDDEFQYWLNKKKSSCPLSSHSPINYAKFEEIWNEKSAISHGTK